MKNHKGVFIKLHKDHDKQVIDKLSRVANKQGYIKELISTDSLFYLNYLRKEGDDECNE